MSIIDTVFKDHLLRTVINPITLIGNCKLLTTKKISYYNHTFNPTQYLTKLRTELELSAEYLSRFIDKPRDKCCNVISITLYNKDCIFHTSLLKYLTSINRTVKNVDKKLEDWIVRLYLDESVYICIDNISKSLKSGPLPEIEQSSKQQLLNLFNNIIESKNVEVYTFICDDPVNLEKTRTYRYLVLIDPEVNISAIREADGYINYLECHNLKMFQNNQDKLFYLPPAYENANLIHNNQTIIFNSYSAWLQFYKGIIDRQYFYNHQNIYDLLAGLFTTKLKIKPDFYNKTIKNIVNKLSLFNTTSITPEIKETYIDPKDIPHPNGHIMINSKENIIIKEYNKYLTDLTPIDFENINTVLNTGFDEIFLLELFKEIISFNLDYADIETRDVTKYSDEIDKIKNLFFSYNIKYYEFKYPNNNISHLIDILKKDKIIEQSFTLDSRHMNLQISNYSSAFIDSIILKNIIGNIPFNIINKSTVKEEEKGGSILYELNNYYNIFNDRMYDTDYIPEPISTLEVASAQLANFSLANVKFKPGTLKRPGKPSNLTIANSAALQKYLKYKSKYLNLKLKNSI